ncbi:MAG: hypothetical protein KatS3mg076_0164 [Candidatus Binatia bacterium]|nr:MAG: hypothetical protein KatS3mg076_0164 [Candidatus Binatia bacterium]
MRAIGLVAGNGQFPVLFARAARAAGLRVVAALHRGETGGEVQALVEDAAWVRVGEVGAVIEFFRGHGVREAVFAGGIDKKRLFREFRPDETALRILAELPHRGDDAVLRAVAGAFERAGIRIVDPRGFLGHWLAPWGVLTSRRPAPRERGDIRLGRRVARMLGRWDVGQTVVVKDGVVVALEALEGTDEVVRRAFRLAGPGCVVVKTSKPGQDLRFDLPALGRETIEVAREAGVSAVAVEAGRTLLLDREELLEAAERAAIALVGFGSRGPG